MVFNCKANVLLYLNVLLKLWYYVNDERNSVQCFDCVSEIDYLWQKSKNYWIINQNLFKK